ncbi:hypothetical protein A5634_07880 [Mycobacterium asiaticum]|uniref:DUF5134 domain-containing protein n=1 Tax=Mycobacterium asiaticum TaxID=1790 RepID=A0A1A3NJU2_MYCAS|nr:DUF5134 domain-containing protein [Mycobacterium asiaticum]OBK22086.1 hypothetical protein A5634_07880 [Mycobacterium asiaticum]
MIDDLPLRWVVTGLFLLSAIGFALVTDRKSWTSVVSHGLHLTMAIAMAVMVWPQGLGLPPTPAEAFFLAAAVWFAIAAIFAARVLGTRLVRGYHAVKMLAMAWMYAVMGGHLTPPGIDHHLPPDVPGMDMAGMDDMPEMTNAAGAGTHGWISTGNWIWAAFFVLAAFAWTYRFLTMRRRRGSRAWRVRLGSMVQAMTATGMAIMFAIMLFQV